MVKTPPVNTGDIEVASSTPRSAGSPGGGHGNPLRYSCLENPMDREAWRATVQGVSKRYVGEGEGGVIWENGIETCIISYKKRIVSPGLMHDTGCSGLVHWDDPEEWDG